MEHHNGREEHFYAECKAIIFLPSNGRNFKDFFNFEKIELFEGKKRC
jgi:hypothetical protein